MLPPNAKTLQAHKTKASMLGLSAVGQQGNIRESSGDFLSISLGKERRGDGKRIREEA